MNEQGIKYYAISGILGIAAAVSAVISNLPFFSRETPELQIRNNVYPKTPIVSEISQYNTIQESEISTEALSYVGTNFKININTACAAELMNIKGIGEKKAQKIIDYRNENGPYLSTDDLLKISGIGIKTLDSIRDMICV